MRIILPNKLILVRENNEIINTMYFEQNKSISAIYTLKMNNINLDIDITTLSLEIKNNYIKVKYLVKDSEIEYEYYIGWSD